VFNLKKKKTDLKITNLITIVWCFRMTTTMDVFNTDCMQIKPELSEIQSFYNDATVFLTGATGFMGNLILEKLLRYISFENTT